MTTETRAGTERRVTAVTRNSAETLAFAAALAAVARPGDRIALIGPLGVGKTQFAKGFARGLGIDEIVNSPSFTLMAEYEGRLRLYHQDLYRLGGSEEILDSGLIDRRQDEGVTVTEWADRLDPSLDRGRLEIRVEAQADDARRWELRGAAGHDRYLHAAQPWLDTATR